MNRIICPFCGTEYLPAEIFIPQDFFGKPEVVRNDAGKIDFILGTDMDTEETFTCINENCGKEFKIIANINFETSMIGSANDDYVTHFVRPTRLSLEDSLLNDNDNGSEG